MERSRLIQENVRLKRENEELRADRDHWKATAAEIAHINTYICEQMNSPLKLIVERSQATKGIGYENESKDEG